MTTAPASKCLLEAQLVDKEFVFGTNTVKALDSISLGIRASGMVALMGPSGSGKSTLLNLFGALDTPSSGKIIVDGRDVASISADERADFRNIAVGFIFQNFNLIPVLSALENVLLPSQLSDRGPDATDRANELLVRVGLDRQRLQSVNRLSGGQMQRVSIARALINKPKIILADEPTANLDHVTAGNILELLSEMASGEGSTVIIATHDHSVLRHVQRVIAMQDGRVVKDEVINS